MAAGGPSPFSLRRAIAAAGGWLSVERFMDAALFDPVSGYYTARVRTVGRAGDFATSATLHPTILGQALARWAWARRPEVVVRFGAWRLPRPPRWHLVELGGGGGQLAAGLLHALGPWRRLGLTYHLVEISPVLRAIQEERLRPWAGGDDGRRWRWRRGAAMRPARVCWHADVASALAAAGGRALVFANEFVDAFPCRVWERRAGRWREVGLMWPEKREGGQDATPAAVPTERLADDDPPADLSSVFDERCFPQPREGQRVETHGRYRDFLARELAPAWRAGRLLTVDYGDELPGLYHRRPRGTRRAYFRHQTLTGAEEFYARPGQQDLTADVNFTDLRRWGRELGFGEGEPAPLAATQAEFLHRWLPGVGRRAASDPGLAFLLNPEGAGGAFRVLEQRPNLPR